MENTGEQEVDYKSVCKQLDVLTNKYFETLETLLKTRSEFSETLKSGFFMMSKARYSMGAKSVGALQYNDNDMTARYLVQVAEDNAEDHKLEIVNGQNLPKESKARPVIENIGAQHQRGQLRKRTMGKNDEGTGKDGDLSGLPDIQNMNISGENDEGTDKRSCDNLKWKDPITWFGVLVPQSLRQSQKDFQRGIEMCGDIVNLQEQLLSLKDDFHKLAAQKKLLKTEKIED
ncbi:coiled-coil domain-containing protein 115-like [Lineus longissimus]|uniref:coiled-coil domain-containing protein 115-like n=1 Tax=Lineus longissimus TaxID=88925 RepID=UPI002B4C41A8